MKKIFLSLSAIGLLILIGNTADGQLASNKMYPSGKFTIFKKVDSENSSSFVGTVTPGVVRSFIKAYREVSNEKWFQVEEGFVAMFNLHDIDYQVAYDKKGNLLHTIRTYDEARMSQDLRHIVKSEYYDYEINLVQEVERPNSPTIFAIQLLGKTKLINLSVCDGGIEILQEFNKSE